MDDADEEWEDDDDADGDDGDDDDDDCVLCLGAIGHRAVAQFTHQLVTDFFLMLMMMMMMMMRVGGCRRVDHEWIWGPSW